MDWIAITELCQELRNWFERERHTGTFEIMNGRIAVPFLAAGQYYRIIGSIFNDGIHQYGNEAEGELTDETFAGGVWALAIPKPVINLAAEIAEWQAKYGDVDSQAMSPYMSESFGGYSYQKGSAYTGSGSGGATSWQNVFANRMNAWRKI